MDVVSGEVYINGREAVRGWQEDEMANFCDECDKLFARADKAGVDHTIEFSPSRKLLPIGRCDLVGFKNATGWAGLIEKRTRTHGQRGDFIRLTMINPEKAVVKQMIHFKGEKEVQMATVVVGEKELKSWGNDMGREKHLMLERMPKDDCDVEVLQSTRFWKTRLWMQNQPKNLLRNTRQSLGWKGKRLRKIKME